MDPNELAAAILNFPIQANGKRDALAQQLAEAINATHAQSLAVAAEAKRDNEHLAAIIDRLNKIEAKL